MISVFGLCLVTVCDWLEKPIASLSSSDLHSRILLKTAVEVQCFMFVFVNKTF